jgi:hypothetical protein
MGLLNLKKVKPGMELADDLVSHLGVLLLRKGRKLTDKNILLLEAWGINEINIVGEEEVITQEEQIFSDALRERIALIDKELDNKFSRFPVDDELMLQIKKAVRKIKIEELKDATSVPCIRDKGR